MQLRIASAPAGLAVLQRIDLGYFYSESEMGMKSEPPVMLIYTGPHGEADEQNRGRDAAQKHGGCGQVAPDVPLERGARRMRGG